jgi:hypothetical protein
VPLTRVIVTLETPELLTVRFAVGGLTIIVLLAVAEPPGPEQVTEYCLFCVGETTSEPEGAPFAWKFVPVQPVAFVLPQVKVEEEPWFIVEGVAESDAVGGVHSPGVCAYDGHEAGIAYPPPTPEGERVATPTSTDPPEAGAPANILIPSTKTRRDAMTIISFPIPFICFM